MKMAFKANNGSRRKVLFILMSISLSVVLLAGCSSSKKADPAKLTPISQVLNWFPQPEQGGQFAAKVKGYYKDAGLDMTILPGGPQVSGIQIVAAGKAEFGMAQGDELIQARDQGIPVVALAAQFQINPTAILFHKGDNVKDFSDLNGRKIYLIPGSMYWEVH